MWLIYELYSLYCIGILRNDRWLIELASARATASRRTPKLAAELAAGHPYKPQDTQTS